MSGERLTEEPQLTEEQRNAVRHRRGPACVIAGAGTGKTTALVRRVVFLVRERKLACDRILVTTFTRKATAELYGRLHSRLGSDAQRIRISTIDAVALDLAQKLAREGLLPHRTLIGEAEHTLLLLYSGNAKGLMSRSLFGNPFTYERIWPQIVELLKRSVSDGEVSQERYDHLERNWRLLSEPPPRERFQDSLTDYFATLKSRRLVDYALLTRDVLVWLKRNRRNTAAFCFDAVVVDEFQDTNRAQAELLLLLSGRNKNIWVVGDPCQHIYEWRGAGATTFSWFAESTSATRYRLADNFRSTQTILDGACNFLGKSVPSLRKDRFLGRLSSARDREEPSATRHPIYRRPFARTFPLIKQIMEANPDLKRSSIAILSRTLTRSDIQRIQERAQQSGFKVQFHSSKPAHAWERTLGIPKQQMPSVCGQWKPGQNLKKLYKLPTTRALIEKALTKKDFEELRELRAIVHVADAVDGTARPSVRDNFAFHELFPTLRNVQEPDIAVTEAVATKEDHIQAMTIHAAKGLEFPIVVMMTLGKRFPKPKEREDARVAYVGATRARDALVLVHAKPTPEGTLRKFESRKVRLAHTFGSAAGISRSERKADPPLVAARHLNLYDQCPLKFAAFHEGRFLEPWTIQESVGKRMHKVLEYYLSGDLQGTDGTQVEECLRKGLEDGDPMRNIPERSAQQITEAFHELVPMLSRDYRRALKVEERYRYVQDCGQVDGVIDAVLEYKNGGRVLIEWKAASEITKSQSKAYELQARAGALGMMVAHPDLELTQVEIVPVFEPRNRVRLRYNQAFVDRTGEALDHLFTDLRNRNYEPTPGSHCKECALRAYCPASSPASQG
jgi:superfamily I DNA/RNA helicase/CRISPR/Cas system-associated exonuclease Cas4 (RecB family)